MTVFIDTGTTTLAFARQLLGRRISIHTNSIGIAAMFADDPQSQVTVLGGEMKPITGACSATAPSRPCASTSTTSP